MKRLLLTFLTFIICLGVNQIDAQQRYVDEIFDEVEVSEVQSAGTNYTVLTWLVAAQQGQLGHTFNQNLEYRVYTPKGDTETDRPLVMYFHTGNFLPFPANASCGGTLDDNANIEICTRLAKMGYVAVSVDYRLGWNPLHPQELVRRYFLINAAYRGVQDSRTYARYFRKTVEEDENPYGIDPEKIVLWGQGTGGYISLASAFLDNYQDILATSDPAKFVLPTAAGPVPMVIEGYNGNIDATGISETEEGQGIPAIVDAQYNALSQIPIGDTLCLPNHLGYRSDVALTVNLGGALGDSTWVDDGEIPVISFHVPTDQYAPYKTDILNVGTQTGPQPVVEVSGSYDVQKIATRKGINDVFLTIPEGNDPIGEAMDLEFPGLLPLNSVDSAPWEWANEGTPGLPADCNTDPTTAKTYIDTIMAFYAPRACVALQLNCFETSTKETQVDSDFMIVAPNPAQGRVIISSDKADIQKIEIYSAEGRVVETINNVNSRRYDYSYDLPNGMYFIKSYFDEGVTTQKVLFR